MSRSSAAARQVMLLPANTPQDSTFPPHVSYLRIKVLKDVHYPSILAILVTFVCIQKSLYLLQIRQDAVEIKHKHAAMHCCIEVKKVFDIFGAGAGENR